ncbi:MAG TPA: pitrilysin family protein [Cyclobacteriaceae bacterium]|nr:pitrilysin family protein [Cyclobacteriaceae bacterium]
MTTLDRTQAPPFQLSRSYSLARPEVSHLSDGIKFFLFRDIQQEVVKLDMVFSAGKWFESKPGTSHFTAQMLQKGTSARNSYQVAEAIDSLGAHLEITPGFDVVSVSLFSLRKNLLAAFRIVVELLSEPAFDEDELRLMKDIFIQNLKVNNEKTNVVASKEIRKAIFGNHHPYGASIEEGEVTQITRTDLQQFFKDEFKLHSVFLIGKLSVAEVNEIMQLVPASLLQRKAVRTHASVSGRSVTINKQESVQTSIRLGKKCIARGDSAKYFDALMFNHLLGGFFGSRLMKNIREEKGLTYGIYSSLHHFQNDSFWLIGAEVNRENAERAVEEIRFEIKALQNDLVPADELEVARNYFIGSWQSENSTLFSVAEKIQTIHLHGLPQDYYTHLLEHLSNITPTQVQQAANTYFDTSDLIEVRVG